MPKKGHSELYLAGRSLKNWALTGAILMIIAGGLSIGGLGAAYSRGDVNGAATIGLGFAPMFVLVLITGPMTLWKSSTFSDMVDTVEYSLKHDYADINKCLD